MKRKFFVPLILGVLGIMGVSMVKAPTAVYGTADYSNIPEIEEVSSDSYITQVWTDKCGARRISDRGVIVNDLSDWGYRARVPGRTFDISSFKITLDLEHLGGGHGMMLIFGSGEGSYDGEKNKMLVLDIVKSRTVNTLFIVTCSAGPSLPHNKSIASFTDGGMWADDSNYEGVQVNADNNELTISIHKDNNALSTIRCNDVVTQVDNESLYAACADSTNGYFCIGLYNGGSAPFAYTVKEIGDASDEIYFSNEGAFGKTKAFIEDFKKRDFSSSGVEQILAAKEEFDAAPYNDLYSYDKAYFSEDWSIVSNKMQDAIEAAGVELAIALLEQDTDNLESACGSLSSVTEIDTAISYLDKCKEELTALGGMTLSQDQELVVSALQGRINAKNSVVIDAAKAKLTLEVSNFESLYSLGITSGDDVLSLKSLKAKIPTKYGIYFEENDYNALIERIDAVSEGIAEATTITNTNWEQGVNARVVEGLDNSIDLITYGGAQGLSNAESSGIFCTEEIAANDFEMDVNFKNLPESTGAWITFGIMEKPEMWINADDDSVQENKGIFFLVSRINSKQLSVQAFLCSLTSNRFYDSPLLQTIVIPSNEDLKVTFKEVQKSIAGVTDTYFEMKFGDIGFDQENITARKLKTVLMSKTGYFMMASSGYSENNPAYVTIKKINGFNPLASSIKKQVTKDITPTSTDSEKTFVSGSSSGKPSFNLDTKDEAIKSVTVDGVTIAATNYSFTSSKLTFTNAYANSLSVGNHTIVVTTNGGSITWTLHVVSNGTDDGGNTEGESKKGCGGSILATSVLVSAMALCGVVLAKRKKED